jgi:hypothetical protein
MSNPGLAPEAIQSISVQLSQDELLRLPARLSKEKATEQEKEAYLKALLHHDPGVFLERHGKAITKGQLAAFEHLREGSYEIDFYLNLLSDDQEREVRRHSSICHC